MRCRTVPGVVTPALRRFVLVGLRGWCPMLGVAADCPGPIRRGVSDGSSDGGGSARGYLLFVDMRDSVLRTPGLSRDINAGTCLSVANGTEAQRWLCSIASASCAPDARTAGEYMDPVIFTVPVMLVCRSNVGVRPSLRSDIGYRGRAGALNIPLTPT